MHAPLSARIFFNCRKAVGLPGRPFFFGALGFGTLRIVVSVSYASLRSRGRVRFARTHMLIVCAP